MLMTNVFQQVRNNNSVKYWIKDDVISGSNIVRRPRVRRVKTRQRRNSSVFTRTVAAVCYDM